MSIRTHGIKALVLSFLAAVSLMAIGAPGAAGQFLINGSTSLNATFSAEVDLLRVVLIPTLHLEIDCAKFKVLNGELTASTGHGLLEILREECRAYTYELNEKKEVINLAWEQDCELYESALDRTKKVNKGNFVFKALLLALGSNTIRVEPKAGENLFAKIFFSNCLIATVDITGAIDYLLHLGGDKVKHLVEEDGVGYKYGAHNMVIDGSIWMALTGAHTGMTWGVV